MKILHIITGLNFGGAEKLLLNTCKEQKIKGNEINIIYFKTEGLLKNEFKKLGIKLYKFNINGFNIFISFFRLFLFIRKGNFDVVHTHLPHANFIGRLAAFIAGHKNIITTIHSTDRWLLRNNFFSKVLKYIDLKMNNSNRSKVIVISKAVKEFLINNEQGIHRNNIYVLYNAINFEDINVKINEDNFIEENKLKPNDYILINIARLEEQKGQIILLKAIDYLVNKNGISNIKCLIIGDGSVRSELEKFIIENHLTNNVFLLGWKENPYSFLKKADLFVLPSLYEGFGIAVLEAYYCEVPVLTTNVDGLNEVVKNKVTGITIDKNKFILLADEIKKFYYKEYDIKYFVENAKKYVRSFDIKVYAKKLEELYNR